MNFEELVVRHYVGFYKYDVKLKFLRRMVRDNNMRAIQTDKSYKKPMLLAQVGHLLLPDAQTPQMLLYLINEGAHPLKVNQENKSPLDILSEQCAVLEKSTEEYNQEDLESLRQKIRILKVFETFIKNPDEFKKCYAKKAQFSALSVFYNDDLSFLEQDESLYRVCADVWQQSLLSQEKRENLIAFVKEGKSVITPYISKNSKDFILRSKSEPLLCFHGALFKKEITHPLMHFGTLKASYERLQDLQNRYKDELNKYSLLLQASTGIVPDSTSKANIKGFYLKIKNPVKAPELCDWGVSGLKALVVHHYLMQHKSADEIEAVVKQEIFNKFDVYSDLIDSIDMPMYSFLFEEPLKMPIQNVKKELILGGLYPIFDDAKIDALRTQYQKGETEFDRCINKIDPLKKDCIALNRTNLIYQRVIRYFESMGYDGIAYTNGCEDMSSVSYIVFRPHQAVETRFVDKQQEVQIDKSAEEKLDEIVALYQQKHTKTKISDSDKKVFFFSSFIDSFYYLYEKRVIKRKPFPVRKEGNER